MRIVPPEGVNVFVFGSSLRHWPAKDIDLLLVYDRERLPPAAAHATVAPFVASLEKTTGVPVHLTLLSRSEEKSIGFITSEGCIPFSEWRPGEMVSGASV